MSNATERLKYLEYLDKIDKLRAVIIGQDPYPNDSTGIAFCKPKITDLLDSKCSGRYVLNSLGLSESLILRKKDIFTSPTDIFYYLFDNGVVFLNISNHILKGEFIKGQSKSEFNKKLFLNNEKQIIEAKNYNESFLNKADKIFVLGKWKTQPIFEKFYSGHKANEVLIHPSNHNTKDTKKRIEWEKVYSTTYLLHLIKK